MTDSSQPVGLEAELKPQARRVLAQLRGAGERGVSNGDFIRSYIERFGGRICEMRKLGWEIETQREGQGKSRYFLRAEPAGVDAGATGCGASDASVDSGGTETPRSESKGEAVVDMGGPTPLGSVDDGSLFDADIYAISFNYAHSEAA